MNKKEISEIRRRFRPDKANIGRIYGCYVNSSKEVISYIDESVSLMPQEEAQQYLNFLKKALSGAPGKNLTDIVFSTEQVMDSEEHRLLMSLREDKADARQAFFQKVIENLDMGDSNYLILCANDAYDVPYHKHDDFDRSAQEYDVRNDDQVYRYFVCAICPVKDGKLELGYYSGENEFHNCLAKQIVSAPELGFLFPAFDNRATNIYNALFYSRKPEETHYEFIDGIFKTDLAMSPAEVREAFKSVLSDSVDCTMDIMRGLQDRLKAMIDAHEENKDEEPLSISSLDLCRILEECGVSEEQLAAFNRAFEERFGNTTLNPEIIVDTRKFEVKTGDVTISVNPDQSFLVESRELDGKKYILIPADSGAELNGFSVTV